MVRGYNFRQHNTCVFNMLLGCFRQKISARQIYLNEGHLFRLGNMMRAPKSEVSSMSFHTTTMEPVESHSTKKDC